MLTIHFLNVGHGDCTIIEHPSGRITMIDINCGDELDPTSRSEILEHCRSDRSPFTDAIKIMIAQRQQSLGSLIAGPQFAGTASGIDFGFVRENFGSPFARSSALAEALLRRSPAQRLRDAGYEIALTNPVEFLQRTYPGRPIFRYIQTHPDLDHMRGLVAIRDSAIPIINFWDTNHHKVPEFRSDSDRAEWQRYRLIRSGGLGVKCLRLYQGAAGPLWFSDNPFGLDHDGIEILSPTPLIESWANATENSNNLSYVLRVSYAGRRIILGGDAEGAVWTLLAEQLGYGLNCDVLKASHHGRESGYSLDALRLMRPTYTVVSVGKKPETDASNKYRAYSDRVWSTRWYGDLTLRVLPNGEMKWSAKYPK